MKKFYPFKHGYAILPNMFNKHNGKNCFLIYFSGTDQ